MEKKEYAISENEIGISIFRGFFSYLQQNNLVYECKVSSFIFNNKKISKWESTGVLNCSDYYSMNGIVKPEMAWYLKSCANFITSKNFFSPESLAHKSYEKNVFQFFITPLCNLQTRFNAS